MVPMWMQFDPTLSNNSPQHDLWSGPLPGAPANGGRFQHYTNVHRVFYLAMEHPLVDEVSAHKATKEEYHSFYNEQGRCTKGHQSPHDLHLITATGAQMYVGVTVNGTAEGL